MRSPIPPPLLLPLHPPVFMNTRFLTPLLTLVPMIATAKWNVEGTPAGNTVTLPVVDGRNTVDQSVVLGSLVAGRSYEFGVAPDKDIPVGDTDDLTAGSYFTGMSSSMGEWWVANSSSSPWNYYQAADQPSYNYDDRKGGYKEDGGRTGASTQPSFHITETIAGGSSFFVGLTMQNQMSDYTSEFRVANNLFPQGTQVYFGLRNVDQASVLEPDLVNGGPLRTNGHITAEAGLTYNGHSTGLTDGGVARDANAPASSVLAANQFPEAAADQFEWVHYQTTNEAIDPTTTDGDGDDLIFTIKKSADDVSVLELTDWVAFFVLPEGSDDIEGDGTWGAIPPADTDAYDDMVFSWTVDGKSGYTLDENNEPIPNPVYPTDGDEGFTVLPEPSSAMMLLGGAGMMLLRRQRKVS